jgi:hypothetical protein
MKEPIPVRNEGEPRNPAEDAFATLRAVAQLPAGEGLEERVKAGVSQRLRAGLPVAAGHEEFGARGWMHSAAMRGLAAAAIVLVVVGGGWGAARYGRRPATPQAVGVPRVAAPGEFSNSGAMRTPQTLTQPKVPNQNHDSPATEKRMATKKAGKREKPAAKAARSGNTPGYGAPDHK